MRKERSHQEKLQHGLNFMLEKLRHRETSERYRNSVPLNAHPFALPMPTGKVGHYQVDYPPGIEFYGWPGYTDPCVDNFTRHCAEHFAGNAIYSSEVIYLRITAVETMPEYGTKLVFFEAGFLRTVVMCGGCSINGDGAGNTGRENLEAVFALLSELYGVPIQRAEIDVSRGDALTQFLQDTLEDYWKSQKA